MEVLIVIILLGILSAIALPVFSASDRDAQNAIFVTNLRYAARQVAYYHAKHSAYPPDQTPAEIPMGMADMLGGMNWTEETPIGGHWDWDRGVFGVQAGVSVHGPDRTSEQMAEVDALLDDGNISSGSFRSRSGGYILVVEE